MKIAGSLTFGPPHILLRLPPLRHLSKLTKFLPATSLKLMSFGFPLPWYFSVGDMARFTYAVLSSSMLLISFSKSPPFFFIWSMSPLAAALFPP